MPGTAPAVPVFPAGYAPLPADFGTWVQAPFTFLTTKVMFRAEHHGVLALTPAGFTQVVYDTILEDPYGGWNSGSGTWTCPAGCSGLYEVTMTAFSANPGTATDVIQPVLYVDGNRYSQMAQGWGVNGHASGASGMTPAALVGGADSLAGYIFSEAGVNTTGTAGQYPTFEACWIST